MPIKLLPVLFLFMACALVSAQNKNSKIKPDARAIHNSAIVIDTHADTPGRFVDENFDMASDSGEGHMDFAKAERGNLGAEFFSIWVDPKITTGYTKRALDMIDSVHEQAQKHPDRMVMAYSADDIVKARTGPHKRLAALMGVEGGHAIENDIRVLREFYRLGARYMTLTWSNTNEWADSSGDITETTIQHHNGLTDFGKDIVREMNRLGMMVDISHVADKTFYDAIEVSKAPLIASHSCARALSDHPRNMTDDMLRALAKNGGVVMVNFYSQFVDDNYRKAYQAQADEKKKAVEAYKAEQRAKGLPDADTSKMDKEWAAKIPRPPFESLINQIDYMVKVAGVDHVGLGSDFDGIDSLPQGIDSVADLPKITEALVQRGYTEEQIHKILGGNLLRVFREVENVSKTFNR
ncbi:MAG TPA: dipeptidase [Terriglobales bacterium]|nr:dipeptidase [Terriglobales bacterium]